MCQLAKSGHHIVECQLMIAYSSSLDMTRPPDDERNTNSPFVALSFEPTQFTVAPEEYRVGSALLMRPVVACEDNNGVSVEMLKP